MQAPHHAVAGPYLCQQGLRVWVCGLLAMHDAPSSTTHAYIQHVSHGCVCVLYPTYTARTSQFATILQTCSTMCVLRPDLRCPHVFLQSLRPKPSEEQRKQLEECFELMDADGSGAIDADELGAAFKVWQLSWGGTMLAAVLW